MLSTFIKFGLNCLPGGRTAHQCFSLRSALHEIGWLRSNREQKSIDLQGEAVPWYSYPAIAFLAERVPQNARVLEFGCGNSTLWWSERAGYVTSIEHDDAWFRKVSPSLPANANCLLLADASRGDNTWDHNPTGYSTARGVDEQDFDVIVIDGLERNNCAYHALPRLSDTGVVIWDNSDRPKYELGFKLLDKAGFRRIDFYGFAPINNHLQGTTIFYRENNCFGI